MEMTDAEGIEGRSLLPETQGRKRKRVSRPNLPVIDGSKPEDGEDAQAEDSLALVRKQGGKNYVVPALLPREVKKVLRMFDGDLALAAARLRVPVSKLDYYVRVSKDVHRFVHQMKRERVHREWDKLSLEDIEREILRKAQLYRSEAQDEIAKLAMMPITDNSAQLQVKLSAAVFLFGKTGESSMGAEIDGVLQRLDTLYKENAPRIRQVRERIIEFEAGSQSPRLPKEIEPE